MGSQIIDNLADGTASDHAVNKGQLDAAVAGLRWKEPVLVTDEGSEYIDGGEATLSSGVLQIQNVDDQEAFGRPLDLNDRVLIKSGSNNKERNGIWKVSQRFSSVIFELKPTSTTLSDYAATGLDRIMKVKVWDPSLNSGNGGLVEQIFKFEDSANGALYDDDTGTLINSDTQVVIQLGGKHR